MRQTMDDDTSAEDLIKSFHKKEEEIFSSLEDLDYLMNQILIDMHYRDMGFVDTIYIDNKVMSMAFHIKKMWSTVLHYPIKYEGRSIKPEYSKEERQLRELFFNNHAYAHIKKPRQRKEKEEE